ncbi:hypothetical protein [Fundidesulfovibrio putealis]|uniref:hypothetical protein n=1 Tax=Fundidesulfovibrio putealis TaxID=270496 RepID=UPI00041F2465|nr:hypothetical protein [Fundidesulfovibrio putealis]
MFDKISRLALFLALAAAACAWYGAPAALAQDDDEPRRDVTIGNPDRMRSGVNERGDNEMVIEAKPKRQQEVPELGPIYVIPQVNNQGYGQRPPNSGGPVIPVPVPQQQPRPAPQVPGKAPVHP